MEETGELGRVEKLVRMIRDRRRMRVSGRELLMVNVCDMVEVRKKWRRQENEEEKREGEEEREGREER